MNAHLDSGRRVAKLATAQHGVVSRAQLLALGLTGHAIDGWMRRGRLIAIHRNVYAVGHAALTIFGDQLAAVLACGPTAVLSHGSAAALWELVPFQPSLIHVTVRTWAGLTAPRGARLHRYRSLVDADLTTRKAIPVTTPARTLLDLAPVLALRQLRRMIGQMEQLRLLDLADVDRLLTLHPRRRGVKRLRSLLADHRPATGLSRSGLEDLFLELFERHGFPTPILNGKVEGIEADFHWPDRRVCVEADHYEYHRTRASFERDRERDAILTSAGWRVHRFTDLQLKRQPELVVAALRASLSSESSS
jgi:hypothetical protein